MLRIGSHVSMSGKDMFLNSVKEAAGYSANTFMLYTGAREFDTLKSQKVLQSLETGLLFCQIFIFNI